MAQISAESSESEVCDFINLGYRAGGHGQGWSYVYSRLSSRHQPEIITIGLNPGGGRDAVYDWKADAHLAPDEPYPKVVNAYFDQPWGANGTYTPLQQQIQKLRSRHFGETDPTRILSFQFIPFRSPSWNELPANSYGDAIGLGSSLLDWTLGEIDNPKIVIGFGLSAVSDHVIRWFDAKHEFSVRTGWGKTQAHVYSTPKAQRLVFLPHLSRYRVIGRTQFTDEARVFAPTVREPA